MLAPSLFSDSLGLFDVAFSDPWFLGRDMKDLEKKLYGHNAKHIMSTDVKETDKGYEMMVDLPGFCKDDVNIQLENGYLTINASKGMDEKDTEKCEGKPECKYIRKERYCGSMSRSFFVGECVKPEDVKASFKHGILTLEFPKCDTTEIKECKSIRIEG